MSRFLFYVPGVSRPVGGVNVIFEWIALLRQNGFEAEPITDAVDFSYDFLEQSQTVYHVPAIGRAVRSRQSFKARLKNLARPAPWQPAAKAGFAVRPDDIIVMPEYAVPLLVAAFPENPRVMLVQTYPWLLRDDWLKRVRTVRLDAVVATSEICAGMTEMAGFGVPLRVPLAIDSAMFHPGDVKKRQISYMPRKRRSEVELVVKALRDRGRVTDFDVVEIDGLPQPQAAEILRESLIFLAFSHAEGFGLPPAEAMAAGCIVIGFTGVGGDEFFSPDISIPISDGNLPAMVRMIEQVVAEYRNDPMRLDAMRHQAAQHIRRNYDDAARRRALFDVFGQIRDKRKVA